MTLTLRRLLAALALVLFTSTAWAEAPAKTAPKAAKEPSKGLFWEAKGKKGTVYLLGSIHMADKSVYPLAPAIEKAFDSSSALAVEADIGGAKADMQAKLMSMGVYTKGETLKKNVSAETYEEVEKQGTALGLPAGTLNAFKPWMAALTITALAAQKAGLNPELGLDMHFLNAAHSSGKKIIELEGVEAQPALAERLDADTARAVFVHGAQIGGVGIGWDDDDTPRLALRAGDSGKRAPVVHGVGARLHDHHAVDADDGRHALVVGEKRLARRVGSRLAQGILRIGTQNVHVAVTTAGWQALGRCGDVATKAGVGGGCHGAAHGL